MIDMGKLIGVQPVTVEFDSAPIVIHTIYLGNKDISSLCSYEGLSYLKELCARQMVD